MKLPSFSIPFVKDPKRVAKIIAGGLIPVIVAVLAIVSPGAKLSEYDLNDGSVWVTNQNALRLGRFNAQVGELNDGLITKQSKFDVLQSENRVLLVSATSISVVDTARVALSSTVAIPDNSRVYLDGKTVLILAPSGRIWVRNIDQLSTLDITAPTEDAQVSENSIGAVDVSGNAYVVDPTDGKLHTFEAQDNNTYKHENKKVENFKQAMLSDIAAIGDEVVALAGNTLLTDSRRVALGNYGSEFALQKSSIAAPDAILGSDRALLSVDLRSGNVTSLERSVPGQAAKPVRVKDCFYAAWASEKDNYYKQCNTGTENAFETLEEVNSQRELVFRVNREVVVLNDVSSGDLWEVQKTQAINKPNWDVIQDKDDNQEEQNQETEQTREQQLANCEETNTPPSAQDDTFGVRPGRTTILPVLANDNAGGCGIIVVSEFDDIPAELGVVESIYSGRSLQIVTAAGASGTFKFNYTITDGRGKNPPSTASITINVRDEAENTAPRQLYEKTIEVEVDAQVSYNALGDFIDDDGDDLLLLSATATEGVVRARQDGRITFQAEGLAPGVRTVSLEVSDGQEISTGYIHIDVRPTNSVPPVIEPIHSTTYVGSPVEVNILKYVRSVSKEPVRLASVEELPGATVEAHLKEGSFTFRADNPGTYYVSFTVVANPQQSAGIARIDVKEWVGEPQPPVAVRDIALLPAGGEVTINPLANDSDPTGGVLVLTSVQPQADSALQIAVREHRNVQITSLRILERPEIVKYTISNGVSEAQGEILVQPVPASNQQRPPVVNDVSVTVRTGGVVTIPVLNDAYDPDGDQLELVSQLPQTLPEADGLLFVSGQVLRYQAPSTARVVQAYYGVRDSAGNVSTGLLTVTVHESDAETKTPPTPKRLTARLYSGETTRIEIPLTGIDVDGDGVALLGLGDTAPSKGRVVAVGANWIEYEAFPAETGTDQFTYAVEDWTGQRALGTIRVGISARPSISLPIVAQNDIVTVQPGQKIEVRVLRNDIDPSGGELSLDPDLEVPSGINAQAVEKRIVVEVPNEVVEPIAIGYTAVNEKGGRASAVLTVIVQADAIISPPIAQDIVVAPIDVVDKTSVEVDVLAVAENPSGSLNDLQVSIPKTHSAVAEVTSDSQIVVQLGRTAQTIPYLLTNTAGGANRISTYAFITVPALGDFPPVLRPKTRELRVASGQELSISLAEFVQVGSGKQARITFNSRVSATKSDGSNLVVDDNTLRFVSETGYAGPASITFEVTDGTSSDDPNGRRATLTLPITVYTEEDFPPVFAAPTLNVGQGDSATVVDLKAFTTGVEGKDGQATYTYQLRGAPSAGFKVDLTDSRLSVQVDPTVSRGSVGSIGILIGYGKSGQLEAEVKFKVTASSRALASVLDHNVIAQSGQAVTVPVLNGSFNPFSDPLLVVSATVETNGGGSAIVSNQNVVVTPATEQVGTLVIRYRVRDVTNDPLREVEGRILLNVRKAPDVITAPRVTSFGDRSVSLSWDAPASNGADITEYRITAMPGGLTKSCALTSCVFDGLTNGTTYRFTVAAKNSVGWSEESPLSLPVTPDAIPGAPGVPTVTSADRALQASWSIPDNPGSPITRYSVEISPAVNGVSVFSTSLTSLRIDNLTNGTQYRVRVRAHNAATGAEGGPWSQWAEGVIPVGLPLVPSVYAQREPTAGGGEIRLVWQAPNNNGGAIIRYHIQVSTGGGVVHEEIVGGATESWLMKNATNGVEYTFTVRAENSAGIGAAGTWNASTFTAPGIPTDVVAEAENTGTPFGGGRALVTWTAPSETGGQGIAIAYYEFDNLVTTTDPVYRFTSLTPGTHAFRVRACNVKGMCSDWSQTASTNVFTVPAAPSVSVNPISGSFDSVSVSWVATGDGGVQTSYLYQVGTGAWQAATASTFTVKVPTGVQTPISFKGVNAAGESTVTTVNATPTLASAPDAPALSLKASAGGFDATWAAPALNGSKLDGYSFEVWKGSAIVLLGDEAAGATTFGTLHRAAISEATKTGGEFTVKIWARSSAGIGAVAEKKITVPAGGSS